MRRATVMFVCLVMLLFLLTTPSANAKERKMVVEYIRYEVPTDQHAQFLAAYAAASLELAASEHCLHYEISQGVEEPDNFVVRIEWDSVEGHERGFRTSPGFRTFFVKVKPYFAMIREMKHYQVHQGGAGRATK